MTMDGSRRPRFLRPINPRAFLRRRWPLLVFLAASLVLRIFLFQSVIPRVQTDSVTYFELRNLDPVRTPGYPLFLELIQFLNDLFSLTPRYLLYIVFIQMFVLGMINCYLIYALARSLTGSEVFALAMGVIFNLDYLVIGFEFLILTETLSLTLLGLTLLFYRKIFERSKSAPYLAGVFSACLLLTRPSFAGLFVCLLGISTLIHIRPASGERFFRKYARPLAVFLLFNLVAIGSWSWRNKVKHGYFGISTILPYQMGYFTWHFYWKYKGGSDPELDKYAAILAEVKGRPFEFRWRLAETTKLSEAEISRILLRLNLKIIRDNPGEYFRLLPRAAAAYYDYSWDWTAPQNKRIFNRNKFPARLFRFFFRLHGGIFKNPLALLTFVLFVPLALLLAIRKNRELFHWLCLIEGTVHYNFLLSVFFTPGGINNLRYRIPVEPFILLVFYAALFLFGRDLVRRLRPASVRADRSVNSPPSPSSSPARGRGN
jgi:hypothetical protein